MVAAILSREAVQPAIPDPNEYFCERHTRPRRREMSDDSWPAGEGQECYCCATSMEEREEMIGKGRTNSRWKRVITGRFRDSNGETHDCQRGFLLLL